MREVHAILANTVILYLLLVGLWGLGGYFRGYRLTPNYKGALIIGELALLAQALVGVTLLLLGWPLRDAMHLLYGLGAPLGLPLAYTYVRERDDRQALLVLSLTALFVFGLALRAMTTAR